MKKKTLFIVVILALIFSCGTDVRKGMYIPTGSNLLKSIELHDNGICYVEDAIIGFKQEASYKISGKNLYITDARGKTASFSIIDKTTLQCTTPLLEGTFKLK